MIDDRYKEALKRPVFIVGAGRSGTTWLQSLLACHPAIATAPETNLFSHYIKRFDHLWNAEERQRKMVGSRVGLSEILTYEEFYGLLHLICSRVFEAVALSKPGSYIVLEKSPHRVGYAELILRLFPQARFIHLLRDPRAVCASMMAAARSWGSHWAPAAPVSAALQWRERVEFAQKISSLTQAFREIRYESLLEDPVHTLLDLFGWLDLPISEEKCSRFVEACRIERLRSSESSGPKDEQLSPSVHTKEFFRKGTKDSWRKELSHKDIRVIEYVARDLMQKLEYECVFDPSDREPLRVWLRRALEGVHWRIDSLLARTIKSL